MDFKKLFNLAILYSNKVRTSKLCTGKYLLCVRYIYTYVSLPMYYLPIPKAWILIFMNLLRKPMEFPTNNILMYMYFLLKFYVKYRDLRLMLSNFQNNQPKMDRFRRKWAQNPNSQSQFPIPIYSPYTGVRGRKMGRMWHHPSHISRVKS
jgi:hypothetical protein